MPPIRNPASITIKSNQPLTCSATTQPCTATSTICLESVSAFTSVSRWVPLIPAGDEERRTRTRKSAGATFFLDHRVRAQQRHLSQYFCRSLGSKAERDMRVTQVDASSSRSGRLSLFHITPVDVKESSRTPADSAGAFEILDIDRSSPPMLHLNFAGPGALTFLQASTTTGMGFGHGSKGGSPGRIGDGPTGVGVTGSGVEGIGATGPTGSGSAGSGVAGPGIGGPGSIGLGVMGSGINPAPALVVSTGLGL